MSHDCNWLMNMRDINLMFHDDESAEANKNTPSASDIQRAQKCLIADKCKNASSSEHENCQLLTGVIEEAKMKESDRSQEAKAKERVEGTTICFSELKLISGEDEASSEKKTHAFETTARSAVESRGRKRVFSMIDTLISLGIVGPLVIGYWRGLWTWMDLHEDLFPAWFCFTTGAVLHVLFAFFKDHFHDTYTSEWAKLSRCKRLPYYALRILYTYIFGVACNAHWRGSWIIIDDYFFMHIWITTCLMCLLLACLATLRCIRNLIAPPLIIFIDTPTHIFQFPTRYNMEAEGQLAHTAAKGREEHDSFLDNTPVSNPLKIAGGK